MNSQHGANSRLVLGIQTLTLTLRRISGWVVGVSIFAIIKTGNRLRTFANNDAESNIYLGMLVEL